MKNVLVVSALDTKGAEILFIKERIQKYGANPIVIDAGILGEPLFPPDFTRERIAELAGTTLADVRKIPSEGIAIEMMIKGTIELVQSLLREGRVDGILSIGGTMGTALGTAVMRSLPVGIPKVMVSTMAAVGDVGVYVGTRDICMFHSVADVAGLNRVTRTIFSNAAGAVVGMVNADHEKMEGGRLIACSTLGTIEPSLRKVEKIVVNHGYETVIFHTVGVGGKCLEELVADGIADGGVIEFSLHEWISYVAGGLFDSPDERYENAGRRGLPQVYVPGCLDFIAHRPGQEKFNGRKTHCHNDAIVLYRSTRDELVQVGQEIGKKLSRSKGPVTVVIPMGGWCRQDRPGGPLWDPDANMGFVEGIENNASGKLKIKKVNVHIMEDEFARVVAESFLENVALASQQ